MGRSDEQAAPTVRARAAEVIEKQREKMRRNLGTATDGRDPEGVHDMRVASRRLRAALGVFAPWLGKRQVQQSSRSLRRLTRALGAVRELDVLRIRLDDLASMASQERKLAIEIIDSRIARTRVRARARMIKAFGSIDLDGLDARLRELAGAPPAWAIAGSEASGLDAGIPWHDPGAGATPDEPIDDLITALSEQVTTCASSIVETKIPGAHGSREASETLHDIRISAKKLRYQLEIIAPYRGAKAAELVDTLKGLQEHLGEFHDDSVLDELLAENITRQAARARPLLVAELRRLRTARGAALRRDERACRSTLENLRVSGFARAVAEIVAPPPIPQTPPTNPELGKDRPVALKHETGQTRAPRPLDTGYAGEPTRESSPPPAIAKTVTSPPAQAAAAAGPQSGAASPRKP